MNQERVAAILRGVITIGRHARFVSDPLIARMFCLPVMRRRPGKAFRELARQAGPRRIPWKGGTLRAWHWRAPGRAHAPRVLLAHGWGGAASSFTAWVPFLLKEGYDVIAYDAPAHGESPGRLTHLPRHARALSRVVDAMGPVDAIVGHSFGAMAAAMAASGTAPLDRRVNVRSLVLVGGPDGVRDMFERHFDLLGMDDRQRQALYRFAHGIAGRDVGEFWTHRMLREVEASTLIIHDRDDAEVPFADAERIAAETGLPLQISTGLGHRRILRDPDVIARAIGFLSEELQPAPEHPRIAALHRELEWVAV